MILAERRLLEGDYYFYSINVFRSFAKSSVFRFIFVRKSFLSRVLPA